MRDAQAQALSILLEWAIIAVVVFTFCGGFLDLGTQRALPGNEAEVFQSLDWVLSNSVHEQHTFPLWNPYLHTGVPLDADPMLHVYNPLASIPVLLLGVLDGFKVALFLSFLAAALGMWWLGRVLGVGRLGRFWMALMFAFTGQAVARFFQGQYLFILGFAWIPWALGSLIAAVETRRRLHIVMAVSCLALLFFSGNVYYDLYMFVVAVVYVVVALLDLQPARPRLALRWNRLPTLAVIGILVLALVAVQLLPLVDFWPHLSKNADPQMTGAHTLGQIMLDYLSKDSSRPDAVKLLPREEFYAYTGIWPFLLLALLPLALWKRAADPGAYERRSLVFLLAVLFLVWMWIDIRHMPWAGLYSRTTFLNQFRYPTRMLVYGACALVALAGIGLDMLWKATIRQTALREVSVPGLARWLVARLGAVALLAFVLLSVGDLYVTNGALARTRDPYLPSYEIAGWLHQNQPGIYYVSNPNGLHGSLLSNDLRYIDAWYHFSDIRSFTGSINQRVVEARPNYVILGNDGQPDGSDPILIQRFPTHTIWQYPHSLPFAFVAADAQLKESAPGHELQSEDVTALEPQVPSPNRILVSADGSAGGTLVVMSTLYPGWFVTVDGKPTTLLNVGGFLAATLQPGVHHYEFAFSPAPFNAGLVISLLALLALLALAWPGLRRTWRRASEWARALPARLPALPTAGEPSTGALAGALGTAPETPPAALAAAPAEWPAESATGRLAADGQALPKSEASWRISARAVYEGGILKPDRPLDLPDETEVKLTVEPLTAETPSLPAGAELPAERPRLTFARGARVVLPGPRPWTAPRPPSGVAGWTGGLALSAGRLSAVVSLEWVLFGLTLLVYAVTRLFALDRFPIYFFADEATHAVLAEQLLQNGFREAHGAFLPLYFEAAGNRWTPLLSVYVHAISVFLFGKSILVTRATSALVSIFGTAAVGLILKQIFKVRAWWLGVLFMAIAPAWFIHTRTGFETAMMSSFYVCFLLFYLLYRTRSPRYFVPALLFGAATFYTYSNGQIVMAAAGVFLILSDIRYHLRNWRTALAGGVLLAVLMAPLIAFRLGQPAAMSQHLRAIDSYWFRAMPLQDKVLQFIKNYTYGLSPAYWFVPNGYDLVRHRLMGYGNLSIVTLPLFLIGLGVCLWRFRSSPHRAIVLAALAAPVGAALVDISITRVLAFIGPACLLTTLGLDWLMGWLARRRVPYGAVAGAAFVVLSFGSIGMLRDALTNGPLWYRDYGLYGMQYGAKQLFAGAIPEYLARDPNTQIMMTSTWANGSDIFIRFFLPLEQRTHVQMLNIDFFMDHKAELNPNMVLVMTPSEYQQAVASAKFKAVTVERVIPYPDGSPGFYFARLAYADNVDAVFAAEEAARRQPVVEQIMLDGQLVTVTHSQFEAGQLKDLFDGDPFTLVRGREANPLVIEFSFPQPRALSGLTAVLGTMDFTLTARLYTDPNADPVVYEQTYRNLPPDPKVELSFGSSPQTVSKIRLEIKHLTAGPTAKIHVRELAFK